MHGWCKVMSREVSYKIDEVKEREHGDFMLIYGWLELLSWLFMKKEVVVVTGMMVGWEENRGEQDGVMGAGLWLWFERW